MHHFGEDSTEVHQVGPDYEIHFVNKSTGERIRMTVPRSGVFDTPGRDLAPDEADRLAREIAHVLRTTLV